MTEKTTSLFFSMYYAPGLPNLDLALDYHNMRISESYYIWPHAWRKQEESSCIVSAGRSEKDPLPQILRHPGATSLNSFLLYFLHLLLLKMSIILGKAKQQTHACGLWDNISSWKKREPHSFQNSRNLGILSDRAKRKKKASKSKWGCIH